jgi:methyltransferase
LGRGAVAVVGHNVALAALPLVHSAWLTAIVFSIVTALVLNGRIREENAALGYV